ncbi:hypothetical protein DQQ10_06185 [Pseudochryseolinea flava]|uniref:Uncharacterized protein n=2 Tax=Pseudochryseolinea flava TaxID=2059302 RepID=A0A364Y7M7_9BACT|nr:hypothetical protein DQQ10_06185 [Pseudochryseolinea flava]
MLLANVATATDPNDSLRAVNSAAITQADAEALLHRTFSGLDLPTSLAPVDPIVLPPLLLADSIIEKRNRAHSLFEKVQSGQRFLESLDALSEVDLPIGIVKSGGAVDYMIIIDRINFTREGAMMDVFVSLALPQTGDRIAFNGKIPLSKSGGIAGTAKVMLLGDHHISLGSSLFTIKGTNQTYVEFDCNGFKGASLDALIQFSRDLIIPEDAKGNQVKGEERVKVNFTTYVQSLNDLMIGVSIPAFQVKGLNGVGFTITKAFMDWSDIANPPGLSFPADYVSPFSDEPNLWRGFFLQRLEMRLPKAFTKNRADSTRVMLGAENMIIDDQGFTGKFFGDNLVQAGDMSGWSYTLDHLAIELVTNQVQGFELEGKISVPVIKTKEGTPTQFGYVAQRGADGNYLFAVSVQNELKFPLFVADLNLYKGSTIVIKERNNKFYPSATLNGELAIKVAGKGPKANFSSIKFEGLLISTEAPHFDIKAVGFGKEGASQSVSKYPLVINNIMLKREAERVGIGFDVTINIGGKEEEEGFGGTAALTVWGKRDATPGGGGSGDWSFDKVELSGIGINFKKPGVVEIAGMIRFFEDDPTYGDGFKGSVSGKIQVISLQIEAMFGKTPEYRYWYADALVEFENGIPLAPGFSAYGFGGGFYSKMKQSTDGSGSTLGATTSGLIYVPDENTIGIKAIVKFGATPSKAPYNGDVMLEVILNRHGGINSVTFSGNIVVMSPALPGGADKIKEMAKSALGGVGEKGVGKLMKALEGQISASVKILFDNVNDVFHANMEMYINVAGGIIKGVGSGNRAGWAVMHFAKDEWYVHIGTPNDPVGLELLWLLKVRSYFMLGQNLPDSPQLPPQISEILGVTSEDLDYMRDLRAAESGTGFAFGIHMNMDTGDLRFLMFYARFAAGIGTDFMIKNYGDKYHCAGSDEPIGINGWFANGQAYAYVQGKIGIKVKLRFYRGKFDILSIGAAAVLQAKGPNPFWMRGIVGGRYSILGGLVKGNCKFEVTLGKNCTIVGESNPLEDVDLIAEVSPVKGLKDVDVFNAPQAAFNIPIGEVFQITDIEGRRRSFRGQLVGFKVTEGTNVIPGKLRWNEEQDVVAFDAHDVFPSQKEIKVSVKLTFQELTSGEWKPLVFDGKVVEEVKETAFTTGVAPDYIPESNIVLSYPLKGQANFHVKEYNQGFIQLKQGQAELFKVNADWIQKLQMHNDGSPVVEGDFSYDEIQRRISFDIPGALEKSKIYAFEILNIPRRSTIVDANVQQVETQIEGYDSSAVLTTKQIEGELKSLEVKSIYSSVFRTSKYNTFNEKMTNMSLGSGTRIPVAPDIFQLAGYIKGDELWDKAELDGLMNAEKLIQFEAVLTGNDWYEKYVFPLVYDGYPLLGKMTLSKRHNILLTGIPPLKDIYTENVKEKLYIDAEGRSINDQPFTMEYLVYNLGESVYWDYKDLQLQVVNYIVDHPLSNSIRFQKFLTDPVPYLRYGPYRFKVKYVIPGINRSNSSYDWQLFNINPDYDKE